MQKSAEQLFLEAQQYIPGGVNSPVRSFNAVGGTPFFTARAQDCYLYSSENKRYIDYVCSWGANIVGHAHPYLVEKVTKALAGGFSYGTPTELELEFAKQIVKLVPSVEKLRLVSSGTEAVMSAIRLARGYTNRKYIIKFNGCYHGHSDSLLVKAGSGLQTFANPSSAGIPNEAICHTIVLEYNDSVELTQAFAKYAEDIAAVIIEPFAGNMNLVRPMPEFLSALVQLCKKNKALLIFDEVMTGFRVDLSCAQGLLGVKPDITTFGKVIGGGMPLAAFGGRAEIMDYLAPEGLVYQAGTLSGNPIAITAGLACLELIQAPDFYLQLSQKSQYLMTELNKIALESGIVFTVDNIGGMFGFYFTKTLPTDFTSVKQADMTLFKQFFHLMLTHGVFLAPSMFEAGFICAKHDDDAITATLSAARKAFAGMTK